MKILLLGDSIRMNYGMEVEKYFKDKKYDFYQPLDNCRFTKYFLRMLFDESDIYKDADVIHFNVGHWDLCQLFDDKKTFSSIDEYKENLIRIVKILLKITPHIIFATTTPVRIENPYNDNKVIDEFNKAAVEIMRDYNIKINDLNALLCENINDYIDEDCIHLSKKGIKKCSEKVIRMIEETINENGLL